MNVEELREFCVSLPFVGENCPWTDPRYRNLITYTVGGKWFCLFDPDRKSVTVKASPDLIPELIERYDGALPAWHMNKRHWVSIVLESDLPDSLIKQLLTDAYRLVLNRLPKSHRPQ